MNKGDMLKIAGPGEQGSTVSELLNAQNGGVGIFVAGRVAAYLTWRTPYKVNPDGHYWKCWMSLVVQRLMEDIESGNLRALTPPAGE